jgi:hypothetical protein
MMSKKPSRLASDPRLRLRRHQGTSQVVQDAASILEAQNAAEMVAAKRNGSRRIYNTGAPTPSAEDIVDHLTSDAHTLLDIASHAVKSLATAAGNVFGGGGGPTYSQRLARYRSLKKKP